MSWSWKPKLRGVSHAIAVVVSSAAAVALLRQPVTPERFTWNAVYAGVMIAMFGASALLHVPNWGARGYSVLRRLDHSLIFIAIAATYTPYAVLDGHARVGLTVMWLFATFGVVLSIAWLGMPRGLRAAVYVAMGLSTTPLLVRLPELIGLPGALAHCAAAVFYITGAVVYARRRPDPLPTVFGFHEVFHLLVIAGAFTQYAVLLQTGP